MRVNALLIVSLAVAAAGCPLFEPDFGEIGVARVRSVRDQAAQRDAIVELRLAQLLLPVMQAHQVDCWLLVSAGDNPDPLLPLLVVSGTEAYGRIVVLLCEGGNGLLERTAIGSDLRANEGLYEVIEPTQAQQVEESLRRQVVAANPSRIAVNHSPGLSIADGLSASDEAWLRQSLGPSLSARLVSSAPLVEDLLSRYLDVEAVLFTEAARLTVDLLGEVLSDQVIVAAKTSVEELTWAVREQARESGLEVAFKPHAYLLRQGEPPGAGDLDGLDTILQPGDLLFLSAGLRYLGYATRYGRWVYLLEEGERQAPAWVTRGLDRLADLLEGTLPRLRPERTRIDLEAALAGEVGAPGGAVDLRVGRVGYLLDGDFGRRRRNAAHLLWQMDLPLRQGSLVVAEATMRAMAAGWREQDASLMLLEDAVVEKAGARFVVPVQRTPYLIE
ncbi:MAG: hypothetical protein ACE5HV_16665 [Acidobacteriota bacterium]